MRIPPTLLHALALVPIWIAAAGTVDPGQLLLAYAVSCATVLVTRRLLRLEPSRTAGDLLRRVGHFAVYFLLGFLPSAVRSAADMARRIVSPVVEMHPGIVAVPLPPLGDLGILIVSNHLTLTPGQLVVAVRHDGRQPVLYVHSIDARDPGVIRREVAELHERHLRRIVS